MGKDRSISSIIVPPDSVSHLEIFFNFLTKSLQVNFLQNHNVKLESENILLRREMENLHRQLYQNQHQSAQFRQNQTHGMQESHLPEQKRSSHQTHQSSDPYQHIDDAVNHPIGQMEQTVTSFQTPSGVIKEINYDHRYGFQIIFHEIRLKAEVHIK